MRFRTYRKRCSGVCYAADAWGDVRGTLVVSGQPSGGTEQWYWKKFYIPGQQSNQSYAKSWAFTWRESIVYQQVVNGVSGMEEIENARKELTKAGHLTRCMNASRRRISTLYSSRKTWRLSNVGKFVKLSDSRPPLCNPV